jgi:hypothetical protein
MLQSSSVRESYQFSKLGSAMRFEVQFATARLGPGSGGCSVAVGGTASVELAIEGELTS